MKSNIALLQTTLVLAATAMLAGCQAPESGEGPEQDDENLA